MRNKKIKAKVYKVDSVTGKRFNPIERDGMNNRSRVTMNPTYHLSPELSDDAFMKLYIANSEVYIPRIESLAKDIIIESVISNIAPISVDILKVGVELLKSYYLKK